MYSRSRNIFAKSALRITPNIIRGVCVRTISSRAPSRSIVQLGLSRTLFGSQRHFSSGADITVSCPSLGDSITEGTIASWEKSVGDAIAQDEIVLTIETDKITSDVRAPQPGKLTSQFAQAGDVISVGDPLFSMAPGDSPPAETPKAPSEEPKKPEVSKSESLKSDSSSIKKQEPVVKSSSSGSSTPPKKPEPVVSTGISGGRNEKRVKLTRMRLRIAERLKESQNTAASLTTFNEIDMSNIMAIRNKFKDEFAEKHGVKLGFMSAFVKASVAALKDIPSVNAVIDGPDLVYRDYIDISVAVATPSGLVVPVLRNCENMSFADVEKNIVGLGKKARDGQLSIEDMTGGTFTISNGGVYGSLYGTPIINQPQSAILGMHGIFNRPVAIDGKVEIRPMMYVALTYDHRVIDGREAVTFLRKIKTAVEDPVTLLLDL